MHDILVNSQNNWSYLKVEEVAKNSRLNISTLLPNPNLPSSQLCIKLILKNLPGGPRTSTEKKNKKAFCYSVSYFLRKAANFVAFLFLALALIISIYFFFQGIFSIFDIKYGSMKLLLFAAKTSSCLNPIVFAVSHPKFREAIAKEIPCLGIGKQHLHLRAFITMKYVQVVVWYDLIVYRGQAKRLWLKQHRGSEDRNMLVESSQISGLVFSSKVFFCLISKCLFVLYRYATWHYPVFL